MSNQSEIRPADDDFSQSVTIAKMYYFENLSKLEIAERLGISRFKVARIIQAALRNGIVEIRIKEERPASQDIASALKEKYDLLDCEIVPTPRHQRGDEALRDELGKTAAQLLGRVIGPRDILGVGWGRSIQAIIPHLPPLPPVPVVQLSGMTGGPDRNATEVVRRIAAETKGPAFPLYAPLLLPSAETAEELRQLPGIASTFGMHERITVALLSIGSWNPPNSQLRVQFSPSDQAALTSLGIRTEMGGILLNDQGQQVVGREFSGRILAIDGARLHQIPIVIGVAGGRTKRKAIKIAVEARYVNSLVTDEATALSMLG